jgi:hypothetical protein
LAARALIFSSHLPPGWNDAADSDFLDADGDDVLLIFNAWKALIS